MSSLTTAPPIPVQAPAPAPALVPVPAEIAPGHVGGFGLFILLNGVLYLRPAEIVPGLLGLELYYYVILATLAVSFPVLLAQLRPRDLDNRPVTACVVGLLVAVVLSNLVHFNLQPLVDGATEFAKILVYFLLFLGLVTTPGRLKQMLGWFALFVGGIALLTILQWHGVIDLPNMTPLKDNLWDKVLQKNVTVLRLQGSGIFRDPNDLCVLMAIGILAGLYWLFKPNLGLYRWLWLAPLGAMAYALLLTGSRGGMLALLVGLLVFLRNRFGSTMTIVLGVLVLPAILLLAGDRQASLSTEEGTSQARIQLWSDGLVLLRDAPLFGIGHDQYVEFAGQVAHNSYLHCFTELGFFGGILFLGAFYLALRDLTRLGKVKAQILDPELRHLQPFVTGLLASYMVGMLSLTLPYVLPTYTVLAFAASYANMTRTEPPLPAQRFDLKLCGRLALVGVIFLVCMTVFVRIFLLRG